MIVAEQGDSPEGVMLLLEGTLRTLEVVEDGRASPSAGSTRRPGCDAIAVLTGALARRAHDAPRPPAASA